VVVAYNFIEHKLKLDDPVGAIAVHGHRYPEAAQAMIDR